ncbi:outer membrane protein assembly factor BamB family protein [Halorubrum saccharovorum]|uniref:outer membrane protein assembly factor BamB family protein n=1 Tax=Halorubrum saccharovorum TaxID=2248 RepID=UPI0009B5BB36|nr:PQQ-binding-like beta-propeller repeat protein [Halorubrum saccharovorum]
MNRRELLAAASVSITGVTGCLNRDTGSEPTGDAVHWTTQIEGSIRHQPVIQDGTVYVSGGTNDRATPNSDTAFPETSENVYAFRATDGTEQWRYEAPAGVRTPPTVEDGVFVVVGWSDGVGRSQRLVRIDDGSETWTTEPRDQQLGLLAVSDGTAYLGTSDDALDVEDETLYAVQTSNGDQRWAIEAGDASDTDDAAVYDDTLYVVEGRSRTTARAVADGSEQRYWDMPPATDSPRVFDDELYLISSRSNRSDYQVVSVSASEGTVHWQFSAPVNDPFDPTGVAVSDDTVCVTEYGGWLFGVDRADGVERWRYSVEDGRPTSEAIVDGTTYVTTVNGSVHAVDVATGDRQWRESLPGSAGIVAADSQGLIIGSIDDEERNIRAYTLKGTEQWSFSHTGRLTQSGVDGTRTIIGTETGNVAALGEW